MHYEYAGCMQLANSVGTCHRRGDTIRGRICMYMWICRYKVCNMYKAWTSLRWWLGHAVGLRMGCPMGFVEMCKIVTVL